jgi:hypothetical protein
LGTSDNKRRALHTGIAQTKEDAIYHAAFLICCFMSGGVAMVATAVFGHIGLGLAALVFQLIPAVLVAAVLWLATRVRHPAGYFIGPLVSIAVSICFFGICYLLPLGDPADPYDAMGASLIPLIGVWLVPLGHWIGMVVCRLVFRRSHEMQRLLGWRSPSSTDEA